MSGDTGVGSNRRRRAGAADRPAVPPVELALARLVEYVREEFLGDERLLGALAAGVIDEQKAAGTLVDARDLTVGSLRLVPEAQLTALQAELDAIRVAVAEHLDGGGKEERLRELLDGTALDLDLTVDEEAPDEGDDDAPEPEDGTTDPDNDDGEPESAGLDPTDTEALDARRRPVDMPTEPTQCMHGTDPDDDAEEQCTEIVDLDQAQLSYSLLQRPMCRPHHVAKVQARRSRSTGPIPTPDDDDEEL